MAAAYIAEHFTDAPRVFRHQEQQPMIFLDDDGLAIQALRVRFFTDVTQGSSNPQNIEVFLAIPSGGVLQQNDLLNRLSVGGAGPSGNVKVERDDYRAEDAELTPPRTFIVNQHGDEERKDCEFTGESVETRNAESLLENLPEKPFSYNCTTSTYNAYKWVNSAKAPLNDAHYYAQVTVRMFEEYLGQKPFQGENVTQYVHYGLGYSNAFYDSKGGVFYGDGDNEHYTLVGLNIVAHEIAHGFTHGWGFGEAQQKMMRYSQALGVNEAFSDITGEVAEYYLYGEADWLASVQNFRYSSGWRNLMNPPADGLSIDHIDDYKSQDGHYTAGIFNKAFYSLVTAQAETTATPWTPKYAFIAFALANQHCWLENSEFLEAADCVVRQADAMAERFAADSILTADNRQWTALELQNQMRKAFALVGLHIPVDGLAAGFTASGQFLDASFSSTATQSKNPLSDIDKANGWQWHWDFGDNQTSDEINPTHTYATEGEYTVTLTVSNSSEGESDSYRQPITVSAPLDACTVEGSPEGINYLALANFNGVNYESHVQGYMDRSKTPVNIKAGNKITYALHTGRDSIDDQTFLYFQIWLDTNQDGWFDPEKELLANSFSKYREDGTINFIGETGQQYSMRVAVLDRRLGVDEPPCNNVEKSEFEDYVVTWQEEGDAELHYELNAHLTDGNTYAFNFDSNDTAISTLHWDFGDGNTAITTVHYGSSHQYASSNTYEVSVKAFNSDEQLLHETKKTIQFTSRNIARFSHSHYSRRTSFTNRSWYLSPSIFHWDFGDGNTSEEKSPDHYYETSGSYTVTLSVFNDEIPDGVSHSETIDIEVSEQPDVLIRHLMKRKVNGAYEFQFIGGYRGSRDVKGGTKTYRWDFGDGNQQDQEAAYDNEVSHTFEHAGTYPVTLEITFKASTGSGDDDWELETVTRELTLTLDDDEDGLYCSVADQDKWNYIESLELNGQVFETGKTGGLINPQAPVVLNSDDNNIAITPTVQPSSYSTNVYQVWIDLNGDYQFGSGSADILQPERVFHTLDNDSTESIRGTFEIPEEYLLPGTTHSRLRVIQSASYWNTELPDPCGTYEGLSNWAIDEVEDYVIQWTVLPDLVLSHSLNSKTLTIDNQTEHQERLQWYWNFGDGTDSTDKNPTHQYNTEGDYTLTLAVSDLDGSLLDQWQTDIRIESTGEPQPNDPDEQDEKGKSGSIGMTILLLLGLLAFYRRSRVNPS